MTTPGSAAAHGSGTAHGSTTWFFSAGLIHAHGTGHEPEYTSRNDLCLLNTAYDDACVSATVYHHDDEPVGPYEILVPARRVRNVRVNDIIDPEAVPLDQPYGLALDSDVPVVAQLVAVDTRRDGIAVTALPGLPG